MSESLGEKYPEELQRCKEILALYKEFNQPFGVAVLKKVIKEAEQAWQEKDLIKMLQCYKQMEGCK